MWWAIIKCREKTASRRVSCRWCRMECVVPLEAQSLYCLNCRGSTVLEQRYNYPYSTNANGIVPQQVTAPSHAYGRKRAVLCGISYKGGSQPLPGSVNSVLSMKRLLLQRFRFPLSSILVLTEEEVDIRCFPTKRNIYNALRWLVEGSQAGDSLVFHYSGHGTGVIDSDGDEADGWDEALVPVDHEREGNILDDELNAIIVRPLPRGATLHAITDACSSGTILDLPNVCTINRQGYYKWTYHHPPNGVSYRGTSGGLAISISACNDNQNSIQATDVIFGNVGSNIQVLGSYATGVFTHIFVQTLEQEERLSYGQLLLALHNRIGASRQAIGVNSYDPQSTQEPQLSSSHDFDIQSNTFTL